MDLGGRTLSPNLYFSASTMAITGTLTLDGNGFTTASDSEIILINGATAKNVFWQVAASATIGLRTAFQGNILAAASVTVANGASINGRALARDASVTLHNNVITKPTP